MGLTTNEWYFFRVSSYDLENETDSSSVLSACDRASATWVNLSPLSTGQVASTEESGQHESHTSVCVRNSRGLERSTHRRSQSRPSVAVRFFSPFSFSTSCSRVADCAGAASYRVRIFCVYIFEIRQ
mgnify:FL=1|jgi:hypothetical protein